MLITLMTFVSFEIDKLVRKILTYRRSLTNISLEVSRGFGFLRFPSIEESKVFVERYYPMIYLYGNSASGDDDQAAKIRIAFSRERDERTRNEKSDGEWTCKIVCFWSSTEQWRSNIQVVHIS